MYYVQLYTMYLIDIVHHCKQTIYFLQYSGYQTIDK